MSEVMAYSSIPPENLVSNYTLDRGVLHELWDKLDAQTELIKNGGAASDPYAKGLARGLAEAISVMSRVYYPNSDLVVKEAVRRNNEKHGIVTVEKTPGYDSLPIPEGYSGLSRTGKTDKPVKPVSAEDAVAIRDMFETGRFTHEKLARTFDCTVEQVKALVTDILG